MEEWTAVCRDCDWVQPMPRREQAEHAKRVHETQHDHSVALEPPES